jgi:hypothetical protein
VILSAPGKPTLPLRAAGDARSSPAPEALARTYDEGWAPRLYTHRCSGAWKAEAEVA